MSALIAKPLGMLAAVTFTIASGYVGLCIIAYVIGSGGLENPAGGRAAIDTITRTAINVLPAIGEGLVNLFQAIGSAVMNAVQS